MLPENRAFLIRGEDGREYGPVELDELREWVQENRAGLGTDVCLDQPGATWQSWQTYPELVALLAEIQGTGALTGPTGRVIAPAIRRILACALDLILCSFLSSPILSVVMTLSLPDWQAQFWQIVLQPQTPMSPQFVHYIMLSNIIFYVILVLYMTGFQAAHGQTPAKAIMRLRVVDQDGQKPGFTRAFLRALVFSASFYFYGIPLFYAFFNPQRRALHDFAAGTYVVEK
jgi:uncharacterized RDD family membrane protein YckC